MSKSVNVDFVTRQIEVDTDGKEHFISAAMAAKDAEQSMLSAQNAANSVQKYKALWFDSVAAMKAEPSLTAGAYVCTAGYYAPNDGGGASYLIRAKADADVDDGGSLHQLANGLVAELIIENGTVNVKQFGAVGDGLTDDTQAIIAVFANAKKRAGDYFLSKTDTAKVYDFRKIKIVFSGVCGVSSTIEIPKSIGLVLENINLVAISDIDGAILKFTNNTRNAIIINSIINGNYKAKKCIDITGYTLNLQFNSITLLKFKEYGIFADDGNHGYEIIIDKCKIYQYEYSEWNDADTIKEEKGYGVWLAKERTDNIVSDSIFNYCVSAGLYMMGGVDQINNCHFYSTPSYFIGSFQIVNHCYFDFPTVYLNGSCSIKNSIFNCFGDNKCIVLNEAKSGKWKYQDTQISGNTFRNPLSVQYTLPAISIKDDAYTLDDVNILIDQNSYNYVTSIKPKKPSRVTLPMLYEYANIFTNCTDDSGQISIGNLLIQYGTLSTTGNTEIVFTTAYDYFVPIVLTNIQGSATSINAHAISITRNGFYLQNPSGHVVKWVAIGRRGY